jgi:antitoxin (DNA-binding transcriptional repressor) of toxin-antitoxin stability system
MPNDITELRTHLFDTLRAVKAGTLDIEKAKTVVDVARVLVESAKVEVSFLATTGALKSTNFLPDGDEQSMPRRLKASA